MSGNISRLAMVWVLALSVSVGRTLAGSSCPIQLNGTGRIRPKAHLVLLIISTRCVHVVFMIIAMHPRSG